MVSPIEIPTLIEQGQEKTWITGPEEGLIAHFQVILSAYRVLAKDANPIIQPERKMMILVPQKEPTTYAQPEGINSTKLHIPLGDPFALTFTQENEGEVDGSPISLIFTLVPRGNFDGTELRVVQLDGSNHYLPTEWIIDPTSPEDKRDRLLSDWHKSLEDTIRSPESYQKSSYASLIPETTSMGDDPEHAWGGVINIPNGIELIGVEGNFLVCKLTAPDITIESYPTVPSPQSFGITGNA